MFDKPLWLFIPMLLLGLSSCGDWSFVGFWKQFEPEYIVVSNSSQGPYGGYREIWWEASDNRFTEEKVLQFAQENGWQFDEKIIISAEPFSYNREGDYYPYDIIEYDILRKHCLQQVEILIFRNTKWIAVKPGNATETDRNGFVVLFPDERRLLLFHRWGE